MSIQPALAPAASIVLEARGLTLEYENDGEPVRAVDNIDLTVAGGERLVLLGPSGCGKSSILKAIAGFLPPAGGEILIRGKPVSGPGPDRIVVFQEFDQLLPWKTVVENVAFPLRVGAQAAGRRGHGAGGGGARQGQPVVLSRRLSAYAFRRHEAARRHRTRAGDGAGRAAHGRAVRRARCLDAPAVAGGSPGTDRRAGHDAAVRHPCDRRGHLIGTRLHLLSAHPGRTIATFDTDHLGLAQLGGAEFEAVSAEVHQLLFGCGQGYVGV